MVKEVITCDVSPVAMFIDLIEKETLTFGGGWRLGKAYLEFYLGPRFSSLGSDH